MSRTYRQRQETFERYYGKSRFSLRLLIDDWDENETNRQRARYYSETSKWYTFGLPRQYRNMINRQRRARDKQALFYAIRDNNEDVCFDPWNCKTSNSWGYW